MSRTGCRARACTARAATAWLRVRGGRSETPASSPTAPPSTRPRCQLPTGTDGGNEVTGNALLAVAEAAGADDPVPDDYGVPVSAVARHRAELFEQPVYDGP